MIELTLKYKVKQTIIKELIWNVMRKVQSWEDELEKVGQGNLKGRNRKEEVMFTSCELATLD